MGAVAAIAFKDLIGSVRQLPLAFSLAMDDIEGRYRRTALGPLWIVLGQAAMILCFVFVFSGMFRTDPKSFVLYLAAGVPVWGLISNSLVDMPHTFIRARGFIESFELPWLLHIWRRSISYVLVFGHQIVILFAVMAILRVPPRWEMLLALPALLVLTVAGAGLGMFMGVLGARYRDLQPAMGVVSTFLFFFSGVVWRPEMLSTKEWVLQYNPFYHLVSLMRDPLLGHAPGLQAWIWTSAGAVGLLALGFAAFIVSRRRLYHWL